MRKFCLLLLISLALGASQTACAPQVLGSSPSVAHASVPEATATWPPTPSPAPTASATALAAASAAAPAAAPATPTATRTPALPPTVTSLPPTAAPPPTLELPAPTATPCADTRGIVASLSITPTTLHYALDARIYLPPCYASTDARYPVLYLIHGLNRTENQWIDLGVVTATETLVAAGDIAPAILVMPAERLDDRFDPAFVEDLIPYIDGHYRTLADRAHRAIGGMSRGAGWALHLGLHYPNLFSRIGAHSPAVFYGDENNIRDWTWHLPRDLAPDIYIDIGDNDSMYNSAYWLDQIFTWYKVKHTYIVQPGAHIDQYWSAHLADYLRFYAAGWRDLPVPPTPTPSWN